MDGWADRRTGRERQSASFELCAHAWQRFRAHPIKSASGRRRPSGQGLDSDRVQDLAELGLSGRIRLRGGDWAV